MTGSLPNSLPESKPGKIVTDHQFVPLDLAHQKSLEILRLDKVKAICNKSLKHFIQDFHFNYAVISLVNYFERRIKSKYFDADFSQNTNLAHPANWVEKSSYKLDSEGEKQDVLLCVMKCPTPVRMIGDCILDPCATTDSLNRVIFDEYNHRSLSRVYLPIIHRGKQSSEKSNKNKSEKGLQSGDLVIGVVEMGFTDLAIGRQWLTEESVLNLQVYVDNFAQAYFHALRRDIKKDARDLVKGYKDVSDHEDCLRQILEAVAVKMQADYGYVAMSSFNYEKINLMHCIFHPADEKPKDLEISEQGMRCGITRHVAETGKSYYAPDVSSEKEPHYINVQPSIISEMAIPMMRDQEVFAVLVFSSKQLNFFNELHIYFAEQIALHSTELYLKKKQLHAMSRFTPSKSIFSESTQDIYQHIVEVLEDYYDSRYVSIWVRKSRGLPAFYLHEATKPEFYKAYEQFNFTTKDIRKEPVKQAETHTLQIVEKYEKKDSTIYKFCKEQGFQAYIVVKVVTDDDYEAFFNVFCKHKLKLKEPYIEDQIFLGQISRRARNAMQSAAMVRSFIKISEVLNQHGLRSTLRAIAEGALEVLHADIVAVFPYQEGKEIKVGDGEHAGEFTPGFLKHDERPAYLANLVAKEGTQWLKNPDDYESLFREHGQNLPISEEKRQRMFFYANNIQSVAAIQVKTKTNEQVLGVMCINYRNRRNFESDENKRFIEAFTNLAVSAFLNAGTLERVKTEKQDLESEFQKNTQLLDKILATATRESHWKIIQGMNHDIRNGMNTVGQAIFNIYSKAKELPQKDRQRLYESKGIIDGNVRMVTNLLDLFDFSQSGKVVVSLNEVIREVIYFFHRKKDNISFDIKELSKDLPEIRCDKMELSMIIYNLTNNAVYAVEQMGDKHEGVIRFTTTFHDSYVIMIIEDNGIGIDNQQRSKIFDLRYTTKTEGLGIGLHFVKETLEKNFFGEISVESTKGHGAKFTVKIPDFINYID